MLNSLFFFPCHSKTCGGVMMKQRRPDQDKTPFTCSLSLWFPEAPADTPAEAPALPSVEAPLQANVEPEPAAIPVVEPLKNETTAPAHDAPPAEGRSFVVICCGRRASSRHQTGPDWPFH